MSHKGYCFHWISESSGYGLKKALDVREQGCLTWLFCVAEAFFFGGSNDLKMQSGST